MSEPKVTLTPRERREKKRALLEGIRSSIQGQFVHFRRESAPVIRGWRVDAVSTHKCYLTYVGPGPAYGTGTSLPLELLRLNEMRKVQYAIRNGRTPDAPENNLTI